MESEGVVHRKGLRKFKLTILMLTILFLVGCSNASIVKLSDKKYLNAVFERNNKIYSYDERKQQINEIGDKGISKELLAVSPNNKKIVYMERNEENKPDSPKIILQDIKGEKTSEIELNNESLRIITDLEWINDERILITSHINPSVLAYGVYNVDTKKEENFVMGILLGVYEEGEKLLYSKTSRKASENKSNIYINDTLIYEVDNSEEQIQDSILSEDYSKIALKTFTVDELSGQVKDKIYYGDFSKDYKISNIEEIELPSILYGSLKIKDNQLYLYNRDVSYKINGDLFTETELELDKQELDQPSEEQLTKFKQILSKKFPNEFIKDYLEMEELQIYNIKFF